jgi:hypothetical protein
MICVDFDGVIHSYSSGWKGPRTIPDEPVPGAMAFLCRAVETYRVMIYSSRSRHWFGRWAMRRWVRSKLHEHWKCSPVEAEDVYAQLEWPSQKPPAFLTIDDRAICFDGVFPDNASIDAFLPWNRK